MKFFLNKSREEKLSKLLQNSKLLSSDELAMMIGLAALREFTSRETMIPRVDVVAIPLQIERKELLKILKTSMHSRFPVYDQNIDDVKGVVHIRDIYKVLMAREDSKDKNWLEKICSEPLFIPESRLILDVLKDLQHAKLQMALVVDEYGGFAGIVTMENILEEVIGDVQDESDDEMEEVIELQPGIFSVDARLDISEINQTLGIQLSDERADTIGGYVVNLFGKIPKKNQEIRDQKNKFVVKTKKGNSVTRIKIFLSSTSGAGVSSDKKENTAEKKNES